MIRRFNYTQRKRIERERIEIEIDDLDDAVPPSFTAMLDLDPLKLPHNAPLIIEAKRSRSSIRFDWGTVGNPTPPSNRSLQNVPTNPTFRVIVVDPDGSGRLLALADNIRPQRAGAGPESLLWLEETELGKEVWRLDYGEHENPTMLVNKNIAGISEAVRNDDAFRALVIPEVLRSILTRAVIVDECEPDDDASLWNDWLNFVGDFYDVTLPSLSNIHDPDSADRMDWIENAVEAFATDRFPASEKYSRTLS